MHHMATKACRPSSSWLAIAAVVGFMIFTACYAEDSAIYLVLMEGDPIAFAKESQSGKLDANSEIFEAQAKRVIDYHDQLLQSTLEIGSYNKLYSFKHIVNGFAVHTNPSQAKKLKGANGVKLVERDRGVKLMTTYTPQFLGLPSEVWPMQEGGDSNAGEGIVIGFVDTGINPFHPSFAYDPLNPFQSNISHFHGACETGPRFPAFSCNGKIVSARYFSAGAQSVASLNSSVDFLSPFDAVGHGSHVASIAAGNGEVPVIVNGFYYGQASGMAPRARIAVYKAIYPTIGTQADLISAIDQAVLDGVDILTLSIGPDEPPEDTLTVTSVFDITMLYARRAGVLILQAAGNRGPGPSTVVSYSPWVMGVAASSTDRTYPSYLLLGNGQRVPGVGLSGPTPGNELIKYTLVLAKDALKTNGVFPRTPAYVEECQHPEAFDPAIAFGSIVICTFSAGFYNQTSTIDAIIDTAKTLKSTGFLLAASPNYGDFIAEPIPFPNSGIMIPKVADVQIVLQYYESQTIRDKRGFVTNFGAQAAIGEGRVATFDGRAPIVSRFSSRGPDFINMRRNPADVLKPDILAPGHQVWAAWSPISALDTIFSGYEFALLSGTSLAAPHVAGIAALIKQRYPSWTPSMIASAISTTATKYDNSGELIMAEGFDIDSFSSTHFDFGAGLVNPTRAVDPGLVFPSDYEDYVGFLCSLPDADPTSITSATGGICDILDNHPSNLNLPSITISALKGSHTVSRRVLNVGTKPETYLCSVLPPNGTIVSVHPPWFTIAPQGSMELEIQFNVTLQLDDFSFGETVLVGSLNHIVRIPLSVLPLSVW